MKIKDITFFVKDIKKSRAFYEGIGFKVIYDYGNLINFETTEKGVYFSLRVAEDIKQYPGKQNCTFSATSVGGLFQKCKLMGIPMETDLIKVKEHLSFTIRDFDGNKLTFIEL